MFDIDEARSHLEGEFSIEALAGVIPPGWVREALSGLTAQARRGRSLSGPFVVWFVVLLGLFRRTSYDNLLENLRRGWWGVRTWRRRPTSSAITKARDRVGVAPLRELFRRTAGLWTGSNDGEIAAGRRVMALDGMTYKVPDSDANRSHFGLPGSSRGRSSYPQMRVVQLLDLGTRVVRDVEPGKYSEGEVTLARRLLGRVPVGSLLLVDRNFSAYEFLYKLHHDRHSDFVARVKKLAKPKTVTALSAGDDLVEVQIARPARLQEPRLKRTWLLRRVTFLPEGAKKPITVLTTILDPCLLTKEEIAQLYHRRWEIETSNGELKTHLAHCATVNRPVPLRSKSPSRIEQELYGLLIAYNAVRRLICDSVAATAVEPLRVSFVAALTRTREAVHDMARLHSGGLQRRYDDLLRSLPQILVPYRPGRRVRREVKIKMSKYPVKRYGLTGT